MVTFLLQRAYYHLLAYCWEFRQSIDRCPPACQYGCPDFWLRAHHFHMHPVGAYGLISFPLFSQFRLPCLEVCQRDEGAQGDWRISSLLVHLFEMFRELFRRYQFAVPHFHLSPSLFFLLSCLTGLARSPNGHVLSVLSSRLLCASFLVAPFALTPRRVACVPPALRPLLLGTMIFMLCLSVAGPLLGFASSCRVFSLANVCGRMTVAMQSRLSLRQMYLARLHARFLSI